MTPCVVLTGGSEAGVRLRLTDADGRVLSVTASRVLAAAGRSPNLDGLGLEATGLRLSETGMREFDRRSLARAGAGAPIFIAGDADGWRPVLHEASRQGGIAGRNAAARVAGGRLEAPEPWPALAMVFTHPQAAVVGAPYDPDAPGRLTGAVDFADQSRARV